MPILKTEVIGDYLKIKEEFYVESLEVYKILSTESPFQITLSLHKFFVKQFYVL